MPYDQQLSPLEPASRGRRGLIIILVTLGVVAAAGAYFAFVYFRTGRILQNDEALNSRVAEVVNEGESIDFDAVAQGDDQATRKLAKFYSTDTETVRSIIQFSQVSYLYALLADYRALHAQYPETLSAAIQDYRNLLEICRTQSGCAIKKIAKPSSDNFTTDVFSRQTYLYRTAGGDFTLEYTMGHCEKKSVCQSFAGIYRKGKNTMTANDFSREQPHSSDQSNMANSNALVPPTLDSDHDGLTDLTEQTQYHTNPTIADTDGDGFSDGQEVSQGYNPNGPGKL